MFGPLPAFFPKFLRLHQASGGNQTKEGFNEKHGHFPFLTDQSILKKAGTLAPVRLYRRSLKQCLPSPVILIYAGFFQKKFFFSLSTEVANCTNFDTFIQLRRNSNMTLKILRIQLLLDYILRHFQIPLQMLMNAQNVS